MRIDALDDLAVELQHEAQHAVRRRMLRAEIDREVADVVLGHASGAPARPRTAADHLGAGHALALAGEGVELSACSSTKISTRRTAKHGRIVESLRRDARHATPSRMRQNRLEPQRLAEDALAVVRGCDRPTELLGVLDLDRASPQLTPMKAPPIQRRHMRAMADVHLRSRGIGREADGAAEAAPGHASRRLPPSSARLRLLVARQHVVRAFPGREEVEVAEFLRAASPARRRRASARRRSGPRRSRSAGSPCAADAPRSRSR